MSPKTDEGDEYDIPEDLLGEPLTALKNPPQAAVLSRRVDRRVSRSCFNSG
jgi:hypothetical protein